MTIYTDVLTGYQAVTGSQGAPSGVIASFTPNLRERKIATIQGYIKVVVPSGGGYKLGIDYGNLPSDWSGSGSPNADDFTYGYGTTPVSTGSQTFKGYSASQSPLYQSWTNSRTFVLYVSGVFYNGFSSGGITWSEIGVISDQRTNATVTAVTVGPQPNSQPTISWTFNQSDGQAQKLYRVKIFTLAQTQAGGFRPTVTVPAYDSGRVYSTVKSYIPPALGNGQYVVYVTAAQDFNGSDWYTSTASDGTEFSESDAGYTAGTSFTVNFLGPVPSSVTPAAGATLNTDLPSLGAFIPTGTQPNSPNTQGQWQMATDNGFTMNLRTVQETGFTPAHTAAVVVPNTSGLFAGTWYMRCRTVDTTGLLSAWSATQSFTVAHPPTASTMTPSNSQLVAFSGTGNTFSWQFSDSSPSDYQVGYTLTVEKNSDGTVVLAPTLVNSAAQAATYIFASSVKDILLRWKIALTDRDNVLGPYSSYNLFTLTDPPVIVITAPSGGVASASAPAVQWTYSGARAQASYQVQMALTNNPTLIRFDSGIISGTATLYTPTVGSVFANGDQITITLTIVDAGGLTTVTTTNVTITYTAPLDVSFVVDVSDIDNQATVRPFLPNGGFINLVWQASKYQANAGHTSTYSLGSGLNFQMSNLPITVQAGVSYTFLALVASNGALETMTPTIWWYNAAGTLISTSSGTPVAESSAGPVATSMYATAPTGAVSALTGYVASGGSIGDSHYVSNYAVYESNTWNSVANVLDGNFYSWRVYRSLSGQNLWTLLYETLDSTVSNFQDYLPPAGLAVDYAVVQTASRTGGAIVEAPYVPITVEPNASYWLISLLYPQSSVQVQGVKDDKYNDQYDSATMQLWGRGRRTEYGTHWGVTGTLTAQYRDTEAGASPGLAALKSLKDTRSPLVLRTPFGQLWNVSTDDLSITRIAGVGSREFVEVAIVYNEVFE